MRSLSRPLAAAAYEPARLTVGTPGDQVRVEPGTSARLAVPDPVNYARRCAGGAGPLPVTLDDHALAAAAHQRVRAGLGVVVGAVPDLPTLSVLDVVLLGSRDEQPPLWQTMLGKARVRALRNDQVAAARSLAGRTGLAAWADRPAEGLPAAVAALADLTRALAGAPRALIWCRPEWLEAHEQRKLTDVVAGEQAVRGFAVLELTASAEDADRRSTLLEP